MLDNNDMVYCPLCFRDVPSEDYDDEFGMCIECLNRLRVDFKNSDNKKPIGRLRPLSKE